MLSLLIALGLSMVTSLALQYLAGLNVWIAVTAGLTVFAGVYFLLLKLIMKKVGAIMEAAQRDIQANRTEKAIKVLQQGFKYAPWQFYIKGQVNSQIGTILYLKRDFSGAFDYLKNGFFRNWVSMGMLAISYMHKNQSSKMTDTFEKAVAGSKKEGMIWNLYAFCLNKTGNRDKAIKVLVKGLSKVDDKEGLQINIDALEAGKKMNMKQYGDMWYQFHLEKPGAIIKQQTKAVQGRRKMVRR